MVTDRDVEYGDRALFLPETETLVVADLHIGRDATSEVELPMGERADLTDRLTSLLERFEPNTAVVAGDFLHSFGSIPYGVPDTVEAVVETVRASGADLVVVSGNHDPMLEALLVGPLQPSYESASDTLIHHGHDRPAETARRYVVGHEHPAIRIEGTRHPCFLDCPDQADGSQVIVLPAFNRLVVGTVVNNRSAADCMVSHVTDLGSCRPIVRSGERSLRFPPLGKLRSLL